MNWFDLFCQRRWRHAVHHLFFIITIKRGRKRMSVSGITLIAGSASIHVTVDDQNGNPLPPADIVWTGMPDGMTASPDAVGFNFAASASVPAGSTAATATYTGPGAGAPVSGTLTVMVDQGVTGLTFTSP